ncbi:hypothetical protein EAF04_008316 [Stromatinia cepivora]|nr:hypothetical protein EAF04_008316 [Stromatinia cepivora]
MSNTGNINEVTRRFGDLRRRNRPNQRRNHNHTPSRDAPEAPQVPLPPRVFTSASESSPFNPNIESQFIDDLQVAFQAASAVTSHISLQRESVALGNGRPIAHQAHTNELEVTPNESPMDLTSHALLEALQANVGRLQVHVDQLQTRIEQMQARVDQLPTRIEHIQARVDQLPICIDQLQTRVSQLQTRVNRFPTRIDELQTHINQFPIYFEHMQARVDQFLIRIDQLQTRVEQLQAHIDRLPTHIDQLQTRVEQLRQELLALQEGRPPSQDETNARNATSHIRKTAVEDLLLSVDGSWENLDPCFCSDPYALMTAAGECHAPAKMPACGHVFGRACIALWLQEKNTCPMCRDRVGLPWVGRDFLMGVD